MPMRSPRLSCFHALCALLLVCGLSAADAPADDRLQVDVVERASGRVLPSWQHEGRRYVAGEPGTRYLIRVRNTTPRRLLAVVSVDGINVLSGETAAPDQRGYVLAPWRTSQIDGWRKSLAIPTPPAAGGDTPTRSNGWQACWRPLSRISTTAEVAQMFRRDGLGPC